jgi:hypothetical protein
MYITLRADKFAKQCDPRKLGSPCHHLRVGIDCSKKREELHGIKHNAGGSARLNAHLL